MQTGIMNLFNDSPQEIKNESAQTDKENLNTQNN